MLRNLVLSIVLLAIYASPASADRWWCTNGHCFLIVETYDANGNVDGYCELHNGPGWLIGEDDYYCVYRGLDDPSSSTCLIWIKFVSTQQQDEGLVDCWGELDQCAGVHHYTLFTSHCYVGPTGLVCFAPAGPPILLDPGTGPDEPPIRGMDDPVRNPHGYGLPK